MINALELNVPHYNILHSKNAGLKNNRTLTQPLGNYGTERALGCFDPSAGLSHLTQNAGLFI